MLAISFAAFLFLGVPQQTNASPNQEQAIEEKASPPEPLKSDPDQAAMRQPRKAAEQVVAVDGAKAPPSKPDIEKIIAKRRAEFEPHRQAAIRINQMAANIHSEKDARALVDAVAEELTNHRHLMWAAQSIRHRVAHAEFLAVADPANLIPDQSIVHIWNEYVREIDAPEEALITLTEVQRMRYGRYRMSKMMWEREWGQTIWNMPNVHAVSEDGAIADGGRPLEMLDILNSLYNRFPDVLFGRDRAQKGPLVAADMAQLASGPGHGRVVVSSGFLTQMPADPIRPAEARYQQEHGDTAYQHMIRRLFDELFPPE
jgi:hypothetical protein